jgi:hypothetical protein
MSRLATRRLIDGAAALGAADRALLNLWVNRGLDDASLARMTGMSPEAIAVRRTRIVEHLSDQLGLPPDEVHAALDDVAASPSGAPAANGATPPLNGTAPPELSEDTPTLNSTAPPELSEDTPTLNSTAPPELGDGVPPLDGSEAAPAAVEATPDPSSQRRRWPWIALALFVIAVLAVVLVISLASGGGGHGHPRRAAAAPTRNVPPVTPTSPSPSPKVSSPPTDPLGALPGGLAHATGTVLVTGPPRRLRLKLSVSHLAPAVNGHYEVWLYNSIIYSAALGRLRAGVTHLSLSLPRSAHRYRWIDISFQPVGVVFHSGESILRAANPATASRARLKKRSDRQRRLRRASTGSSRAKTSK